jgi:C-terminal processing protease CtpA/Prc
MKTWNKTILLAAAAMLALPAAAQEPDELDQRMQEAERRLAAEEAEAHRAELDESRRIAEEEAAELARLGEQMRNDARILAERRATQAEEYEVRMQEAERRMAEAAQQMAVLSMRQLPQVERIERVIRANRGPVLGVTIGGDDSDEPVEGVKIRGVSPGGAAEEAGLRSGDIITTVNDESLAADNAGAATDKLLDFMEGVEAGDTLDIEYLRNGKTGEVELTPRPFNAHAFAFEWDGGDFTAPDVEVHVDPSVRGGFANKYIWIDHEGGFGSMEMVKLTERLGSYFGTDEGLLIVRAPNNEDLKLEDGDVILNIDGREPTSVSHALRILGSYQAGESLEIEIMRDKRKRKLDIVMPDTRRSGVVAPTPPGAVVAPRAVIAPRAAPAPRPSADRI